MPDSSDASERNVPEPSCRLTRNEAGVIISVEPTMADVLGWTAEELATAPSTTLIHPEDQSGAIAMWFEMVSKPGSTYTWRGRYRTSSGGWQWVETINTNHLDDPDCPLVETVMRRIAVEQASIADELRARRQLINRLADAVPVGLFQFDAQLQLSFINDRFLDMFGPESRASCEAQFEAVIAEDLPQVFAAFESVLANQAVDALEIRFRPPGEDTHLRVCQLNLRPLTDSAGLVSGAIGAASDVTDSVDLRRELEIKASIDAATGCLNRQASMDVVELLLRRVSSSGVGVIFLDVDRLKEVNDRLGHAAGDAVLAEVATRVRGVVRTGDNCGRLGGDEFLVICPDVGDAATTLDVADRIARVLKEPIDAGGADRTQLDVQASIGVAWTAMPTSSDRLIAAADSAMYESKRQGQGLPVLAPPLTS